MPIILLSTAIPLPFGALGATEQISAKLLQLGTYRGGAVAMIFVFGAFYKMAGPTQDAYFMEISPYGLRAKTSVIKQFGDAGANLFSGFVNPIGLDAIAWKYYIVWCCVLISNVSTRTGWPWAYSTVTWLLPSGPR